MKHRLLSVAAMLAGVGLSPVAFASSHREAPAIAEDPAADNTDVWAFVSPGAHDKLYVIAAYNPLEEPSGGPNFHKFSDDVLYQIHITRGPSSLEDVITYNIEFSSTPFPRQDPADLNAPLIGGKEFFAQIAGSTQTYRITKYEKGRPPVVIARDVPVAPVNIGPRTNAAVYKSIYPQMNQSTPVYDDAFAASFINTLDGGEGRAWAGPRDDGFYVDLGGVFDLANLRGASAKDSVAGYNCHAIALEIPTTKLTANGQPPPNGASDAATLGVWASASRRKVRVLRARGGEYDFGPWVQVSRLGLPLINEAVIGLQDKDKYNRTYPSTDLANFAPYFLNPVIVRDAKVVGILNQAQFDAAKSNRTDIIDIINLKASGHTITTVGDVLRVDLGLDSSFPNGRPIPEPDVTDVLLSVLLLKAPSGISDGVNRNDKPYLTGFPWLALPWEGYSQGHGAAAN